MKDINQKEVDTLTKKEWSEPQMIQLGVKETKGAIQSSYVEGQYTLDPDLLS